jgi:hypothetical protein
MKTPCLAPCLRPIGDDPKLDLPSFEAFPDDWSRVKTAVSVRWGRDAPYN